MSYLIHNAEIHTLNPKQPRVTALAIEGSSIVALGSDDEILDAFPSSKRFNAENRPIIPGLADAHIHIDCYTLGLQKVACETDSRNQCLEKVAERVTQTPPGEWILGHGWNQNQWLEGFGSATDLDQIAPNNPVYLTAKSLHAAWVNSAALRIAGISQDTNDPPAGRLGRYPDGTPDGILFESAMQLVSDIIPAATVAQLEQAIIQAQPTLLQMGLTSLHDFDHRRCFSALQNLHQRNQLHIRVTKSLHLEDIPVAIELGVKTGFGDDTLRIGSVKGFADGALGPHTAAMLQPYDDDPNNTGILMLNAEDLIEQGKQAVENGLSLAIHAIGDRANHEVLNAYSRLRELEIAQNPASATRLRHRIEHVQLLHSTDVKRLAQLGVIASMQPIHATSDMEMADRCWGERTSLSYAWRTQLDHGAVLAFGSDAPVESPNPFFGLHAAVTRRRADGGPGENGWHPEHRLSLMEALQGFTGGPAYATGMENRLGKLAPGYLADLLVLDTNIFTSHPDQITETRPVATMIGGAWVWQA